MVSSTARRGAASPPGAHQLEEVSAASQAALSRLVESMLHDARNPLNAMAINLEVLHEKLKDETGAVDPALEKNLRAMREQVYRVDLTLRTFADFLINTPERLPDATLADVLPRAVEVLGHQARTGRVKLKLEMEPGVTVRLGDSAALRFLAYHSILRAVERSAPGSEVEISLQRAGERAALRVQDAGDGEPNPFTGPALEALGREQSVEVTVHGGRCELLFKAG